jgi:hypothetical protein
MPRGTFRIVCLIIAVAHLAACAKTAAMQPLGIHAASSAHKMKIKDNERYQVTLRDGSEHIALGNAIHMTDDIVSVYSYEEEEWKRYPKAHVEEITLIVENPRKARKRSTLITGMAVLACFFAVSAGSYFIQKEIRK